MFCFYLLLRGFVPLMLGLLAIVALAKLWPLLVGGVIIWMIYLVTPHWEDRPQWLRRRRPIDRQLIKQGLASPWRPPR